MTASTRNWLSKHDGKCCRPLKKGHTLPCYFFAFSSVAALLSAPALTFTSALSFWSSTLASASSSTFRAPAPFGGPTRVYRPAFGVLGAGNRAMIDSSKLGFRMLGLAAIDLATLCPVTSLTSVGFIEAHSSTLGAVLPFWDAAGLRATPTGSTRLSDFCIDQR